jgi:hypothetical protein
MRIVSRLLTMAVIFLACGGAGGVLYGWSEYKLGAKSTPEPVEVDLAKLEQGQQVDNNHLKIGDHYACYWSTIYSYKESRFGQKDPDANMKIEFAFYPIVSPSNPDVQLLQPLLQKYGDLSKVPDNEDVPLPTHFVVLVKTTRYKTVGAIPKHDIQKMRSIQGLAINEVSSLSSEEKKLIQEEFPAIDFNKVMILQDGRKPSSTGQAIAFMAGGGVLLVLGLIGLVGMIFFKVRGQTAGGS